MAIDNRARVFPVYYRRGFFDTWDDSHETKDQRLSRAPFDLVQIERVEGGAVDRYISPTAYPTAGSPDSWGDTFQTNHELECFGYVSDKFILVNENELGSHTGNTGKPWNMFELHYV